MKSSLVHHVHLELRSAAVILGTTEGELYAHFQNNPPDRMTLSEIDDLAKLRLKTGKCDSFWFNSELAQKDPLLTHPLEELCFILQSALKYYFHEDTNSLIDTFKLNAPKNLNLGGILEALRIINSQYPVLTDELHVLLERLSRRRFFRLT